ncbi:flagellar basal body rod protein FlgC [Arcobacter aquimarinus]|uniref:Flagellar basal-body rod protein FlgC n=1 Tax=Arcobacter aquimarinus TaxID=1315211 RepID=A0AAE7B3A5_9BACT|nr:flagellar basal body rod protein FlgC [Arcobacter aquimarinus]MCB9097148.1 flagellar basal body rod protein FlgC [Arcobacter sp.]QKE26803.1 flagellar proximal rod protein FlgC [Arcobacter aquimarinus]RXI32176.1 flagellar basal body rod protein FlgC [Arcobacter aquimarinus]
MGFFDGYNVASSGMSAQRTRINVVSANIANAKTTHTEEGGPYKKQQVVFEDILVANTNKKANSNDVETTNSINSDLSLRGVGVKSIIQSDAKPVMKYDPTHPDANEQGYVAYPDINPVIEMVDLIEAMRSYEANVTSFNTHKNIDSKTLEILNM